MKFLDFLPVVAGGAMGQAHKTHLSQPLWSAGAFQLTALHLLVLRSWHVLWQASRPSLLRLPTFLHVEERKTELLWFLQCPATGETGFFSKHTCFTVNHLKRPKSLNNHKKLSTTFGYFASKLAEILYKTTPPSPSHASYAKSSCLAGVTYVTSLQLKGREM